jgi:hypothetical protein
MSAGVIKSGVAERISAGDRRQSVPAFRKVALTAGASTRAIAFVIQHSDAGAVGEIIVRPTFREMGPIMLPVVRVER